MFKLSATNLSFSYETFFCGPDVDIIENNCGIVQYEEISGTLRYTLFDNSIQ